MGPNQIHPDYASCESDDGVVFSKGNMIVNGIEQLPEEVQQWLASNGLSQYTTVKWADPTTGDKRVSCNCQGWAVKRKGKPRQCKHVKDMMGMETCDASPITEPVRISTVTQAEAMIPKFEGRNLRGIMLD